MAAPPLIFLLILLELGKGFPHPDLLSAVESYWTHLIRLEKVEALPFVDEESRNRFLLRNEPVMRSWKLVDLNQESEATYRVTVQVERMIQGSFFNWKVSEEWVKGSGGWRVRITDPANAFRQLFSNSNSPRFTENRVRVEPNPVKLHFLSEVQSATVSVWNGLSTPVELLRIEYDHDRFELLDPPVRVGGRSLLSLRLRYIGTETKKNLESELKFTLREGQKERLYRVRILYNYISPGARGLFRLTEEALEHLDRKQLPPPKLQAPDGVTAPEFE